jgi:hypothetical protein
MKLLDGGFWDFISPSKVVEMLTFYVGGGGSPGPTTSTVNQSNLPEYVQPYVESMLGAAQKQVYTMDGNNVTGFQKYTPYSTNMNDYQAGFSPMQQQAFQGAANLQLPGQIGAGSQLAGASGLGSLGAAGQASMLGQQGANIGMGGLGYGALGAGYGGYGAQAGQNATGYGALGAGYGMQAGQAGQNFANQATNPNAVQAYMNPYLQSALQPQLQEIGRQYDITGTQQMGNATRAGAFGGSREALMAAENQRNKNMAMNQAIGQGYNTAFQNAQQQMQYGAGLGLQGQQAAMQGAGLGIQGQQAAMQGAGLGMQGAGVGLQGINAALAGVGQGLQGQQTALQGYGQAGQAAGTLGQLGTQQLAAQQGILGTQNQFGGQQQAQEQAKINQAIQNYATEQQFPMLQLGNISSLLRGLPMQSTTTQTYQAQPGLASQIGALGTGAIGLSKLAGAKAGGSAKDISKRGGTGIDEMHLHELLSYKE